MSRSSPASKSLEIDTPQTRPGYTLLELVIVLAIIASLMAIAWPRVSPLFRRSLHREAALQLKSEFADAREQAVMNREVWEFRGFLKSNRYALGPVTVKTPTPHLELRRGRATDRKKASSKEPNPSPTHQLPDGAVFGIPSDSFESDSSHRKTRSQRKTRVVRGNIAQTNDDEPMVVVRFYPDGRATEAAIDLLWLASREIITVQVRGLTGNVSIEKVKRPAQTAKRRNNVREKANESQKTSSEPAR